MGWGVGHGGSLDKLIGKKNGRRVKKRILKKKR
jgi:hypothetical protein